MAFLRDNINANDQAPPPPSVPLELTMSKADRHATRRMAWFVITQDRARHSFCSLFFSAANCLICDSVGGSREYRLCAWAVGMDNRIKGIMGLGVVPNVQVIAPSRGPSSIWNPLQLLPSSSDVKYFTHLPVTPRYQTSL